MFAQYLSSKADSLIRIQCTIGIYIQCKFIVISDLSNTGVLNNHVYSVNRSIDCIYSEYTDRHSVCFSLVSTYISTSTCDCKLHSQSAVFATVQSSNDLIWIHDFDILICLNISSSYDTFALTLNVCGLWFIVGTVILDSKAFQIHDDF